MRRFAVLLFALVAVALLQPLLARPAHAWWSGEWPYRVKIDADAGPKGANVTQPIGRTQILVRLFSGNFNFGTVKDDGSDIRFIAGDDKTPLHFHIARFDPLVDQVALIWVDVPDLAPGTTTPFYLYWGNKNATAAGDPHATFDPDQVLVYEFGDENGLPKDQTANGINALTGGKRSDAGITGFALQLDGTKPVQMPQNPALNIAANQAGTWSAWIRFADAANTAVLWSQRDDQAQTAFTIGFDHGVAYAQIEQNGQVQRTGAGKPMKGDMWHRIDVTEDNGKLTVYVDGQPAGDVVATLPAIAGKALLGGAVPPAAASPAPAAPGQATPEQSTPAQTAPSQPAPSQLAPSQTAPGATPSDTTGQAAAPAAPPAPNFSGLLDEFEISRVARPVGAIQLAYANQGPDPKLLSLEQPEESSIFGTGYIGVILKSVTPDAWVVIGILLVMMLISWLVMIMKALYVSGLGRANRAFRQDFIAASVEDEHGHLAELSDEKRPILKRSSLWRIYRVGVDELRQRFARGRLVPGEPVPPQSLTAIRSALDAVFAREIRRLNGAMVLLTIAIAGGPFIGLLGTVIGVMITFAAIAAAGDVNVNAIAPGISAALLATVTGLAVAIPALFGYNYFTIRIRDATTEMQVFIEELVARMGEGAGGRPRQVSVQASAQTPAALVPVAGE